MDFVSHFCLALLHSLCISDFISSIQLESTLNASNCCTVAGAAVEAEVVGTDFVRAATPEDTSDCDTSDERDGSDDATGVAMRLGIEGVGSDELTGGPNDAPGVVTRLGIEVVAYAVLRGCINATGMFGSGMVAKTA